jgi:hypothetical protein
MRKDNAALKTESASAVGIPSIQPTALRHDARKLGCARLLSDDCEGHTIELVELDCRGRQWTLPYYV